MTYRYPGFPTPAVRRTPHFTPHIRGFIDRRQTDPRGSAVALVTCATERSSMTLRISQTLETVKGSATLRLEGSMSAEEALLLERYCDELAGQSIGAITLDLEGLTFLDDEGGDSIRRLRE